MWPQSSAVEGLSDNVRSNKLKNILHRPFKFGLWFNMPTALEPIVFLPWLSTKGIIGSLLKFKNGLFFHSWAGLVLTYRRSDHPTAGMHKHNIYVAYKLAEI